MCDLEWRSRSIYLTHDAFSCLRQSLCQVWRWCDINSFPGIACERHTHHTHKHTHRLEVIYVNIFKVAHDFENKDHANQMGHIYYIQKLRSLWTSSNQQNWTQWNHTHKQRWILHFQFGNDAVFEYMFGKPLWQLQLSTLNKYFEIK